MDHLFEHLFERRDLHRSAIKYAGSAKIRGRAGYIAKAEWPTTLQPEVPGHIADERPAARHPLLLIAVNSFFVAAEFAVVRSRRGRLEQMRDDGVRGAGRALEQLDRVDEFVATSQVGITLASLGIGFLGEPALAELLEPLFSGFARHAIALALAIALAFIIVTFLHVILGEQSPKMVAIASAETDLIRVTGPLIFLGRVLHPLIVATNAPANFLVNRVFRIERRGRRGNLAGGAAADHRPRRQTGRPRPRRGGAAGGVFHLHEQEAREVMTPIPAVVTVDADETVEAALRRCVTSGHTRLVVIEDDNPDRVRGVIHNNCLARVYMSEGPEATIESVDPRCPDRAGDAADRRPPARPPGAAHLALGGRRRVRADGRHRHRRGHPRGGGGGDRGRDRPARGGGAAAHQRRLVRARPRQPRRPRGRRHRPARADSETYNSVGGYVFGELGRLPKRGDSITVDGYTLRVEAVRENRIEAVRISDSGDGSSVRPGA